jgi:hypothetical protein
VPCAGSGGVKRCKKHEGDKYDNPQQGEREREFAPGCELSEMSGTHINGSLERRIVSACFYWWAVQESNLRPPD